MSGLGTSQAAAVAFNHFGLGGRPNATIPADPVAWLLSQLQGSNTIPGAGLPTTAQALSLIDSTMSATAGSATGAAFGMKVDDLFATEVSMLLGNALVTPTPFRERLVWLWMNHLPIMAGTIPTMATAGVYVREAIRPNVTGRYSDMLLAAILHPAMLYSLSNDTSIGPNSPAGLQILRQTGTAVTINENLGRETLELFTVGVGGGYTQADVDALACLLTGCNVNMWNPPLGFAYNANRAQPGTQILMGNSYPNTLAGLQAALLWLGTHPLTYRQLATKMVTHFTGDAPSPRDIQTVTAALAGSGGNLGAAAAAIVRMPSAWVPLTKLRTPVEYVIAALRGLGAMPDAFPNIDQILFAMGQPLWSPPFPNGWSDLAADWISPEGTLLRGDWANTIPASLPLATAGGLVAAGIGPLLSTATIQAVNAATSTRDQIALLLTSPEFQRR